jgi:hypothetical protein
MGLLVVAFSRIIKECILARIMHGDRIFAAMK